MFAHACAHLCNHGMSGNLWKYMQESGNCFEPLAEELSGLGGRLTIINLVPYKYAELF